MLYMGIQQVNMEIILTEWALQSYFELLDVFTAHEYNNIIRPDAMLLSDYPNHPKFRNSKFWGPCKDKNGGIIHQGYKMKWHHIGSGLVQLRLLIVLARETAFICNAYVKDNESTDFRQMAKLKNKIQLINEGRVIVRGRLT